MAPLNLSYRPWVWFGATRGGACSPLGWLFPAGSAGHHRGMTRIRVGTTYAAALLCVALTGCGDGKQAASHAPTAHGHNQHGTVAARQPEVPPLRADDEEWPFVPTELKSAIPGKVLVAGPASAKAVRTLRCESRDAPNATRRLLNATIDDFSLKATFRETLPEDDPGDSAGKPILLDCSGMWDRTGGIWRKVWCRHYAPARPLHAMTVSGAGMVTCGQESQPRVPAGAHALIWLVPPAGARWIVVHRGSRYAVAYPVHKRQPVRVLYLLSDAPEDRRLVGGRIFRYEAVTASGQAVHKSVLGYTAG